MVDRDDLARDLEEFMEVAQAPENPTRFTIDSDDLADWAVRKIIRYQSRADKAKKLAKEQIARIEAWLQDVTIDSEQRISYFEMVLQPYIEQQLAGGKAKTYKLPSGSVQLAKQSPEFEVGVDKAGADTPELIEYAQKSAPELLKIKETVNWGELKKQLIVTESGHVVHGQTGEVLPFIRGTIRPDKLNIKEMK